MISAASVDEVVNKDKNYVGYTEQDAFDALYAELERGVKSMKRGDVYTVEEAWEEIDRI